MNLIPTNRDALKTWLVDLSGNIAISGAGVAFLDLQITEMEKKCATQRIHLDKARAVERIRRARLQAAPRRESALKLGPSIGLLFEEQES